MTTDRARIWYDADGVECVRVITPQTIECRDGEWVLVALDINGEPWERPMSHLLTWAGGVTDHAD